jgi:predicted O-linked N-acetylglucosamine transferase (SPINDLY family)
VFGSFNNVLKLSDSTIALWARILLAVPDALLLLKSPSLKDASVQARYTALFAQHGVAPDRLRFRGPTGLSAMMQEYGDVDVALDPLPYNGGTTTLQALWQGVPVLTLEGGNFVSRMGASFLRALGQDAWVAADADAYVAAAAALARDRASVRAGREQLRARMLSSPVSDIDAYVRHFETALDAMWQAHCAGDGRRLLNIR